MTRVVAFCVDHVRVLHYVMGDVDLGRMGKRKEVDEKRAEQSGTQQRTWKASGRRIPLDYLFVSCV